MVFPEYSCFEIVNHSECYAVFETWYIQYLRLLSCILGPTMYLLFHLHIRFKNLIFESQVMGSKDEATRASTFTSEDKFPAK